jgi:hypothetical protein
MATMLPRDWYATRVGPGGEVQVSLTPAGVRGLASQQVERLARRAELAVTVAGRKRRVPQLLVYLFVRLWWFVRRPAIEAHLLARCGRGGG